MEQDEQVPYSIKWGLCKWFLLLEILAWSYFWSGWRALSLCFPRFLRSHSCISLDRILQLSVYQREMSITLWGLKGTHKAQVTQILLYQMMLTISSLTFYHLSFFKSMYTYRFLKMWGFPFYHHLHNSKRWLCEWIGGQQEPRFGDKQSTSNVHLFTKAPLRQVFNYLIYSNWSLLFDEHLLDSLLLPLSLSPRPPHTFSMKQNSMMNIGLVVRWLLQSHSWYIIQESELVFTFFDYKNSALSYLLVRALGVDKFHCF